MEISLDGGDLFLLSGFQLKDCATLFEEEKRFCSFCSESVVWSCASWALSRGAAWKRVSVSGDSIVAIDVGMIDCQARQRAPLCVLPSGRSFRQSSCCRISHVGFCNCNILASSRTHFLSF